MHNAESLQTHDDSRFLPNKGAQKQLLTVSEAAKWCNLKEATFYEKARRNEVPGVVRFGRILRIDATKLADWIENGGQALPGGWRREEE